MEQLDDVWLCYVYWHPRDKDGKIAISTKREKKARTRREEWLEWGRSYGWPDWYTLERYELEQAEAEKTKAARQEKRNAVTRKEPKRKRS